MLTPTQVRVWFAVCLSMAMHFPTITGHKHLMRRELQAQGGSSRRRDRRRRSRRRSSPRRRGTINVEFAGKVHGVGNNNGEFGRPEVVKSERCDKAVCHECQNRTDDGCWYGTAVGSRGEMSIAVQANSLFDSFVQEVFLSCSTSGGHYHLAVHKIKNGKIAVYVNNALVREVTSTGKFDFTFDTGTKARVRSVFVPINKGKSSSAEAKIEGKGVDESVDKCMTTKLCMNKLGDDTDAAFELRNSNHLQYKCLVSGANSLSSHLQLECTAWEVCLPAESKDILKVLLKISGASLTGSSFADKVSAQGNLSTSLDPNTCVNPAVDDPESFECECLSDMETTCGGVDEDCFKGILCGKAEICQTWKDDAGCTTLIQKSEAEISGTHSIEALRQRIQESASSGIDASLDGSLHGKCSQ